MQHSLRIGVFLQLDTEHGRGVLRGIAQFFRHHPSVTVLRFARGGGYQTAKLANLGFDGIIAKVTSATDDAALTRTRLPVVNISGQYVSARLTTVNTDDIQVGRLAFRHLYGKGYRHFAYCGNTHHRASVLRLRGLRTEALTQGVWRVAILNVPRGGQDAPYDEKVRRVLDLWLSALPTPVGVLAFTDRVALEVDEACSRVHRRVPEDIAILGVGNDLTRLEFARSDVSSIQLNTQRLGFLAAEVLMRWLDGAKPTSTQSLIPPLKIVTRHSTDLFAVDDEVVAQAMDYIREHVSNTVYVEDVARTIGVSRRVLETRFRRALNSSVYAEVQRLHFEQAVELLSKPEFTIGEVAYTAGFETAQSFSRAFKSRFGRTPKCYRAHLLG